MAQFPDTSHREQVGWCHCCVSRVSLLERGDKEMECAECGSCFVEKVASEEQESDLHGFLSIDNNLGPVVAEGEGDVDAARESARDVRTSSRLAQDNEVESGGSERSIPRVQPGPEETTRTSNLGASSMFT